MGVQFHTSEATCAWVRERTDRVILAFSRGKDSISAWLQLRRYWDQPGQIVPVAKVFPNLAGTAGLRFEEESLAYYEDFFGTRIYRIFHHEYVRQFAYKVFQPPERAPVVDYLLARRLLRVIDNEDRDKHMRKLVPGGWIATGLRVVDSLQRQRSIKKNGSAYADRKLFYPVWDWRNGRQYDELERSGVRLPIDYLYGRRSFEGLGFHELDMLKRHYPDDYEAALFWFPMAELQLTQLAYMRRRTATHAG